MSYFGLRDYGTATWQGGDAACDHKPNSDNSNQAATSTLGGSKRNVGNALAGYGSNCGKCGARRVDQQIGLEPTPEAYVAKLVDVFREVRRILHPTGVVFLNLGDSYSSGSMTPHGGERANRDQTAMSGLVRKPSEGLGPKQLLGIPWRVAFALQADGWVLRQDIIWGKTAPMPESVTDRCTKSHEYVFLLAKSPTYFYDAEAIKEEGSGRAAQNRTSKYDGLPGHETKHGFLRVADVEWHTRNKRSVWTLGPEQFAGGHFAVMPTKLVEPCILAGSSSCACAACGAPWERVVERERTPITELPNGHPQRRPNNAARYSGVSLRNDANDMRSVATSTTTGWAATCTCQADVVPCTILDPFVGSGTVGFVSLRHNRNFIGIDLNADYLELARTRIEQSQPMLFSVV